MKIWRNPGPMVLDLPADFDPEAAGWQLVHAANGEPIEAAMFRDSWLQRLIDGEAQFYRHNLDSDEPHIASAGA